MNNHHENNDHTDDKRREDNKNNNEDPQSQRKKKHKHRKQLNNSDSDSEDNKNKKVKEDSTQDFIAENFVILNQAGQGAFGEIFLSFSIRDDIEVAIKKEKKRSQKTSQLKTEGKIYQTLLNIPSNEDVSGMKGLVQEECQGVPKFYGVGELFDCYYLIMEFLGPNLNDLLNFCRLTKFTVSCVCLIALQMLNRIENLHKHHYLHRDIKPENFVIGTDDKSNIIYLIDFGLSKRYKNPKNHQHIVYREGRPLAGTARYVSINTHLGVEQSRRDDLESIGYVLIYFLKGTLPWQGLKEGNDKYVRIMEKKLQIPTEILCYGLPDEMIHYLNYCKNLRFEDRPDYDYLRSLFIKLLGNTCSVYGLTKEYLKFDWCFDEINVIWKFYQKGKGNNNSNSNTLVLNPSNKKLSNASVMQSEKKGDDTPNTTVTPFISYSIKRNLDKSFENKTAKPLTKIEESVNAELMNRTITINSIGNNSNNNMKTNENNPNFTIESSGNESNHINDNNENKRDNSSENTIEFDEKICRGDIIKDKLSQKNIEELFSSLPNEDIDGYITRLLGKKHNEICKDTLNNIENRKKKFSFNLRVPEKVVINKGNKEIKLKDNQIENADQNNYFNTSLTIEKVEDINNKYYVIGSKNNKAKLKDSIEINNKSYRSNCMVDNNNQEKDANKNNKTVPSFINNHDNRNKAKNKKANNSDSGSSRENNITLLKNTMKNSKIGLTENESKELIEINKINPSVRNDKRGSSNLLSLNNNSHVGLLSNRSNKNCKLLSFEQEILPKISNPEMKQRRKSRIFEMSNLSDLQVVMKFSKENLIKIIEEPLMKYYKIISDLGQGAYGQVKRVRHINMNEERAMKIVNKKSESSQNEIEILRKISHPNIVNIFEIFEDSQKYYIMYELLEGGELFEAITAQKYFTETDAMKIMKQILEAVNYLHCNNIVHRDLKPENIMLVSKNNKTTKLELKIIDFGTAKQMNKGERLTKFIGTSYYIAPEVIKENYNEKCDIWSCGVIMYILLCGYPPFNGGSNNDIYHSISNLHPVFCGEEWKDVSPEAIDLIKSMLNKNPMKRINAETCLKHRWFKQFELEENKDAHHSKKKNIKRNKLKVINKMANFVKENRFKQAVLQFITTQFNLVKEEEKLTEMFKEFDTEKTGLITKQLFLKQLNKLYGENDSSVITESIFKNLDLDGNGEISYNEFLTSLMNDKKVLTADRLDKAFKMFDKDGNGKLSLGEIKQAFGGEEKVWKSIIEEVDKNKDGEIDFAEFKALMNGIDTHLVPEKTYINKGTI